MSGDHEKSSDKPLAPGLYLVATPIGNLEDITLRALRILRGVDRIACEDTRQTQKLLNHFEIHTPTVSYHLHNEGTRTEELTAELKRGARIAVVSDAGTPGVTTWPLTSQLPRSKTLETRCMSAGLSIITGVVGTGFVSRSQNTAFSPA